MLAQELCPAQHDSCMSHMCIVEVTTALDLSINMTANAHEGVRGICRALLTDRRLARWLCAIGVVRATTTGQIYSGCIVPSGCGPVPLPANDTHACCCGCHLASICTFEASMTGAKACERAVADSWCTACCMSCCLSLTVVPAGPGGRNNCYAVAYDSCSCAHPCCADNRQLQCVTVG
jgi:hypothetical protein